MVGIQYLTIEIRWGKKRWRNHRTKI